ncbi:hypothetical protein JG676_07310 [Campylobacter sp. 2018MI35]|uniref:hypothetical protein n=1 Tax=unclassified Campylobacter TaxID=2593542 RepID=UPI0019077DCB|nr:MULTISPECIES: hypothetical protein [unclassified Campylobacter]MBK1971406.1 hypothetical protein [Campylobacter sp. TTU_617]MBK1992400.1 hypothetical protein [Campylobacter sp. 2018MI34]
MIFLIPLLIFFAVIFGIDYLYFSDEDLAIKEQKEIKAEVNNSLKQEYLKQLFNTEN